ncbi:diguanylate cyclase domain-containing protein [Kineococcus gynurae]|uniref:Diguanylate cyclase domain-containing protein n=1 Tax=Kineococcus gynurae TaxID=452979 RepID=A0ABV5LQ17_9ACTN
MRTRRDLGVLVVGFVVYLLAALLGRWSRPEDSLLALVWPSAAVGTIWFGLVRGARGRLAASVAILVATLLAGRWTGGLPASAVASTAMGVLQFVVTARLLDRHLTRGGTRLPWRLRTLHDLWWLLGATALGSLPMAVLQPLWWSLLGNPVALGEGLQLGSLLVVRNVTAVATLVVPVLLLLDRRRSEKPVSTHAGALETVLGHAVGLALAVVVLLGAIHLPLGWLVMLYVFWVAQRRPTLEASALVLVTSVIAVIGVLLDLGPFVGRGRLEGMLIAQAFLVVLTVVSLATAVHRDRQAALLRAVQRARNTAASQRGMLEAVFAASNVGLVAYDRDGRALRMNAVAEELFSHFPNPARSADAHVDGVWATDPTTDAPIPLGDLPLSRARNGETVTDMPLRVFTPGMPQGRVMNVSTYLLPEYGDDEWGGGFVLNFADVTAAHDAGRELARAHALLSGLFDAATEQSIIAWDLDLRITTANAGAERLTGYSRAELIGRSPGILHESEELTDRARELGVEVGPAVLCAIPLQQGSETRTWTVRRRDGATRPVRLTVTPILSTHGETTGFIGIGSDISAELRARAVLTESEQIFRLGFLTAPVAMFMLDVRTARIRRVNAAASVFTGRSEDELLTLRGFDLLHEDELAESHGALEQFQDGSLHETRFERRFVHADGTSRWAVLSTSLVESPDADPYLMCHLQDVTDRKLAEQEIVRQAQRDALTDLANRTLFHQRLREALSAARGEGIPVGVAFVDLDGFKAVNDTGGHRAGDAVLRHVADRLRRCVRDGDTVARLGGDEFALLCTSVDSVATLAAIAERALDLVEQPIVTERGVFGVGASIGVRWCGGADLDGLDRDDDLERAAEAFLHDADEAMYTAKHTGKGQVVRHAGGSWRVTGESRT